MIYLISQEEVEKLNGARAQVEMTDSANLKYTPGSRITQEAAFQIRQTNQDLIALVQEGALPVFFGPLATPYRGQYASVLTALCLARPDGQTIRGISYLPPYDEYWFSRDLGRCFRYGYRDDTQHFWRVIGHAGDVDWLRGYWGEAAGFAEWLARWIPSMGTGDVWSKSPNLNQYRTFEKG